MKDLEFQKKWVWTMSKMKCLIKPVHCFILLVYKCVAKGHDYWKVIYGCCTILQLFGSIVQCTFPVALQGTLEEKGKFSKDQCWCILYHGVKNINTFLQFIMKRKIVLTQPFSKTAFLFHFKP